MAKKGRTTYLLFECITSEHRLPPKDVVHGVFYSTQKAEGAIQLIIDERKAEPIKYAGLSTASDNFSIGLMSMNDVDFFTLKELYD